MKIRSIVALCLIVTAVVFADDKNANAKKAGSVSGVVVREPGSQPLKKATVTLVAENQTDGGNYTATTDANGRFSIDQVRPGRYRMLLERTGYVEVNERQRKFDGRTLSVSSGEELKDLQLNMLMTATVLGRVVDEDGDPLPAAEVTALRKSFGKTQWEALNSERTNDLGEFRLSGLFPGRYYLSVSPAPDYQRLASAETPADASSGQPDLRRVTTFYPGTTDRNQAASLDLRAGDEIPVNFTMIPGRAYAVRGSVVGVPAGKKAAVILVAREYSLVFNSAEIQKNGKFEVRGVPPGSYVAMAMTDDETGVFRTARQYVDVGSADVEDVRLAPVSAGVVRGQIFSDRPAGFSHGYVSLHALFDDGSETDFAGAGDFERSSGASVQADGSFEIKNVLPGEYAVEFMSASGEPGKYFVSSVRLGASAADIGFSINGSTGPLYITLSSHSAAIEGSAVDDHDKPLSDCTVVAVPEEQFRKIPARFGKSRTDQNGHFTIRGLAPGPYTVFAWQDLDGEPYLDSAFLKTQPDLGKSIHADADKTAIITIKAAEVPVDSR